MSPLPLVFLDEARAEFGEAAEWYDEQKPGLGSDFIVCVQDVLDRIAAMPRLHPVVYENVRRAVVKRFPYVVYYEAEADRVVIISVFHSSRNPSIWQGRV